MTYIQDNLGRFKKGQDAPEVDIDDAFGNVSGVPGGLVLDYGTSASGAGGLSKSSISELTTLLKTLVAKKGYKLGKIDMSSAPVQLAWELQES